VSRERGGEQPRSTWEWCRCWN